MTSLTPPNCLQFLAMGIQFQAVKRKKLLINFEFQLNSLTTTCYQFTTIKLCLILLTFKRILIFCESYLTVPKNRTYTKLTSSNTD
ncbi:hypothetical protein WN48_02697 [Eufriesea mexicana]|uniref:Uncharacterized protein n=1 Tax=Eufriesea mexicana TaxID=516756 RepID=A0A310SQE7_9HYME|nr:hypothetical protein WN48_02697 [Eufriesea mexicana]